MARNTENMIEWLSGDSEIVLTITDQRAMTMIERNGWEPTQINPDKSKMYRIPFDRLRTIKPKKKLTEEEKANLFKPRRYDG